ncbi:hypothetical protein J6590_088594 [Homalodisca vitripennis]|nr:hypothetical protein J6590_088594 [Homalodisca vitripennis]
MATSQPAWQNNIFRRMTVLNEDKTQQLHFGPQRRNALELPNASYSQEAKYLGITLDSNLNWKLHVDQLCKKLSTALYVIKRLKQISNMETSRTAYFALFEHYNRFRPPTRQMESLQHFLLLLTELDIPVLSFRILTLKSQLQPETPVYKTPVYSTLTDPDHPRDRWNLYSTSYYN